MSVDYWLAVKDRISQRSSRLLLNEGMYNDTPSSINVKEEEDGERRRDSHVKVIRICVLRRSVLYLATRYSQNWIYRNKNLG
jgi:hypothetical protein